MHSRTERFGILGTHSLFQLYTICGITSNCAVGRPGKGELKYCQHKHTHTNTHNWNKFAAREELLFTVPVFHSWLYPYPMLRHSFFLYSFDIEYLSQKSINISNVAEVSMKLNALASNVSDWVPADAVYTAVVVENIGTVKGAPVQVCFRKRIHSW